MIHDNIKDTILNDLIREDEERIRGNDVCKDQQTHDRSFSESCPGVLDSLEHDKFPEEVHSYAARIIPNVLDKDELTSAQAQRPELSH